jgi:hypothetical protein
MELVNLNPQPSPKPSDPSNGDIHYNVEYGEILIWDAIKNQWIPVASEGGLTKEDILDEFERNPDLYNEVMIEMRNRKIKNIKK